GAGRYRAGQHQAELEGSRENGPGLGREVLLEFFRGQPWRILILEHVMRAHDVPPDASLRGGLGPALRTFSRFFSASNQKGAPNDTASAVRTQPTIIQIQALELRRSLTACITSWKSVICSATAAQAGGGSIFFGVCRVQPIGRGSFSSAQRASWSFCCASAAVA